MGSQRLARGTLTVTKPRVHLGSGLRVACPRRTEIVGKGRSRPYSITEMLSAGTQGFTAERLNVRDLVAKLGAQVEGIVFLADASGRMDDEFAWCITIPAKSGGVM